MNETNPNNPPSRLNLYRNWTSLVGLVMMVASLFAFLLLFVLDSLAHFANPYVGILTYLVAPFFMFSGAFLAVGGFWLRRRQLVRANGGGLPSMQIDLTRPRDRRLMAFFLMGSVAFLFVTALESYHTYHFTESVQFCGEACHTVMKPELVSYQHSPHARVACTECHIGKGATWYVRSKLSGMYQVYATLTDKFPRPVPTPIHNLRPAQETCEQCHWPQKFVGNLDRTYTSFLSDETNSSFSIRLLLNVGGGDPTHGPVEGIHWHMNVGNKIEYIASDEARQQIPWVRMTDPRGTVTVFKSAKFTNQIDSASIRRMDCMDCHNRPAHNLQTANGAVNLAMALGKIDTTLPYIKTNVLGVLTSTYATEPEALQNIAKTLDTRFKHDARIGPTIQAAQQIYKENFFPEMKASWKVYPDNIGHKDWPGCFRCHDGKHMAEDGKRSIKANDCNACHVILAQGRGAELDQITPKGQKFKHPEEEYDPAYKCNDCHSGGL